MITGSIVALVTPMHGDGSIDWDSFAGLLEWHVEQGTDAVVAVGTTGESATVDVAEHTSIIKFTVDTINKRIPVIAGTGANSTSEAIELTQRAKSAGADACLLVTPYYNKPTQEGLYRHHMAIADAVQIPQILYNVPGRTACDMQPATIARLADHVNIVAVKEATGDVTRIDEILALVGSDFQVYSGDDGTALEAILRGAKGNISVTANVAPQAMHQMCAAALSGDADRARDINSRLMPLNENLFLESNPIPVKWVLQRMGKMEGGIRLPLTPLDAKFHDALLKAMAQADISGT